MADIESKLFLFLSVDLIGSTRFKSEQSKKERDILRQHTPSPADTLDPPWAKEIATFFPSFQDRLLQEWKNAKRNEGTQPHLLKAIGDEAVFFVHLKSHKDAVDHIRAFKESIYKYNLEAKKREGLSVKGTAWVAGVPINNKELQLLIGPDRVATPDFIGPSMDAGFRLTKLSDHRKLVISIDLAYLVCEQDLALHYDGEQSFKGVLDERAYPVFWLHTGHRSKNEKALEISWHPCDRKAAKRFIKNYIKQREKDSSWLVRPYIRGDRKFSAIPDWHKQILDARKLEDDLAESTGEDKATTRAEDQLFRDNTGELLRRVKSDQHPKDKTLTRRQSRKSGKGKKSR